MHVSAILRPAAVAAALLALALPGTASAGKGSDSHLLKTYQPVTVFDLDERLRPTKVDRFVHDSVLERLDGTSWTLVDPDPSRHELPGPGTGVWRLNQATCSPLAFLGGLDCYAVAADHGGDSAYGRVVRTPDAIVLQYWYFYYDNTYSYFDPPSDVIWQAHEGDWEVVNVVLSADGVPVSVGYSQHCLGQRRAWAGVTRRDETHPVVYVAAGSHANYFDAGEHLYNPQCVPIQAQFVLAQLGLGLPRDHTSDGRVSGPGPGDGDKTHIRRFDDKDEDGWTQFPGFWGELQYFHAPFVGTVPFGTSPVGPAYKPIFHDPLAAMAAWPQT